MKLSNPMCEFSSWLKGMALTTLVGRNLRPRRRDIMPFDEFIIAIFVLVDDTLKRLFGSTTPWRRRGPQPILSDSEVLTMEIIGEFRGLDTDKGIFEYFRAHWLDLFPQLARVARTTFVRQASRLAQVKVHLWQALGEQLPYEGAISLLDSFPLYVCQFARAKRCRRFREEAAFGHDELLKQTFYGFRWHLRVCWPGVIRAVVLAPANISDLEMALPLLGKARGWALGDRNYWSPERPPQIQGQTGVELLAPFKQRSREPAALRWPRWLTQVRRRIETVIGQLTERYHAKRTWARDTWHLLSRVWRKVLSHTVAMLLSHQRGHELLQFERLVVA